jgi:hypothetical protein
MSALRFPYASGMELGVGVNAISGDVTTPAFKHNSLDVEHIDEFRNERKRLNISSASEYREKIDASAEFHGKGFGWSASGSVKFMKDSVRGLTSVVFFDSVQVKTGVTNIADPDKWILNESAVKILRKDPHKFIQNYGTHFVGGFEMGGSYVGAVTIETESSKQASELSATLSGAYSNPLINVDAKAAFSRALQESNTKYKLDARSFTEGEGTPKSYSLGNIDSMREVADNFAEKMKSEKGGKRLVAICYPWDYLPCIRKVLGDGNLLAREVKKEVIDLLSEELLMLEYHGATIKHFLDNHLYLGETQEKTLIEYKKKTYDAQQKILDITIDQLHKMEVNDVDNYIKSTDIEKIIIPIDNKQCTIICDCTIFPEWVLIGNEQHPPISTDAKKHTYQFELANLRPEDKYIEVARTHVPGKYMGYFYVKYDRVGDDGKPDANGKEKLCTLVDARGHWCKQGSWAKDGETSQTDDVGGGLIMSACFK